MIFVTLGTQDKSFVRLLEAIQKQLDLGNITDKVIVQAGHTKFESNDMEIHDLLPMDRFDELIESCDLLITHGGVGSIIAGLKKKKKVIVAARLSAFNEHTNDHQLQIIDNLKTAGYILELSDFEQLDQVLIETKTFKPKIYRSNAKKMQKLVKEKIEESCKKPWWFIKYQHLFYFALALGFLDCFLRYKFRDVLGTRFFNFSSIWFTLSAILLMVSIASFLSKRGRRIFITLLSVLWSVLFVVQSIYLSLFQSVFTIRDVFLIREGTEFAFAGLSFLSWKSIVALLIFLAFTVLTVITTKYQNTTKMSNRILGTTLLICSGIFLGFGYYVLGPTPDGVGWDNFQSKRYIYNTFDNRKANLRLTGFYHYSIRDLYMVIKSSRSTDKKQLAVAVDEYLTEKETEAEINEYSGLLKGKNLILIMMENIDRWMITEAITPTLYKLQQQGINFTNRYSPGYMNGMTFNTEFIANTGFFPNTNELKVAYSYVDNDYSYSLPSLFLNAGYTANSFHKNYGDFYNRKNIHLAWGYEEHYDYVALQLTKNADLDQTLVEERYDLIVSDETFFSFIITYSPHLPFSYEKEECQLYLDEVKTLVDSTNEEYLCGLSQAKATDEFMRILLEHLEVDGILEDTVIIAFSDHYAYGMDSDTITSLKNETSTNLLQNTPFFIWQSDLTTTEITTAVSTVDILPTIADLFGLEYDHNFYPGTSAFSSKTGFVPFVDGSWIDGNLYYNGQSIVELDTKTEVMYECIEKISQNSQRLDTLYWYSRSVIVGDYLRYKQN